MRKTQKAIEIGQRIKSVRDQKGLTQLEVGAMLGVTDNAVTQWEKGYSPPTTKRLQSLADNLGVSVGWLLTGDDPLELRRAQTERELKLLEILRSVSLNDQDLLIATAKGMAEALTKK